MTRNLFRLAVSISVATCAIAGCTSADKTSSASIASAGSPVPVVKLTYRTGSDRLNLSSGVWKHNAQLASYGQPPTAGLPNMTISELRIESPHPAGYPDYALGIVEFRPPTQEAETESSFWSRFVPWSDDDTPQEKEPKGFYNSYSLAIPQWQVDTVLKKLEKDNFFRRSRVLGPNAYIEVDKDGNQFGKRYRSVPQLDALILQIRTKGHPSHRGVHPAHVSTAAVASRPPAAPYPGAGPYPNAMPAPSAPHYGNVMPHRYPASNPSMTPYQNQAPYQNTHASPAQNPYAFQNAAPNSSLPLNQHYQGGWQQP